MSPPPEIKMGVLLGRSPAGRQALTAWAEMVAPTGMPLKGPDTPSGVLRSAACGETAGLVGTKRLVVGLSGLPGRCGAVDAPAIAAYAVAPSGDPCCRPSEAA